MVTIGGPCTDKPFDETCFNPVANFAGKTRRVFLVVRIFLNGPVSSQVKEMEWQKSEISQFFWQVSFAGHRSQLIVLPIPKVSKTLVKANLRPN